MNKLLYCYLGSIFIGLSLHYYVGYCIKVRFKKNSLYDEFSKYYEDYKKKNRSFKSYARYIVYLIPIFNLLISFTEYFIKDEVYVKVLKNVKSFNAKEMVVAE